MTDEGFHDPRLASLYDALDADRSDLDAYVAIAAELDATRVLDVGCGTGTLALLLAERGHRVIALDPAEAMLDVARAKPGAAGVRWVHGDVSRLRSLEVDLAIMAGNVAQAIVDEADWHATLLGVYDALRPGGHLVFESAFQRESVAGMEPSGVAPRCGDTRSRVRRDVGRSIAGRGSTVSFRWTYLFPNGEALTSDSTLRFRERDEVEFALTSQGYVVDEVRDAADRPGREFVFFARRPELG